MNVKRDRDWGCLAPVIVLLVLVAVMWLGWKRYSECRQHFSVIYCLTDTK